MNFNSIGGRKFFITLGCGVATTVLSMAATLGLTDAQLDALFTTAAGIEA